jgi:hypothetical protein
VEWDNNQFKLAFDRSGRKAEQKVGIDSDGVGQQIDGASIDYEQSRTGVLLGFTLTFVPDGPHVEAIHAIADAKQEFRLLERQMADQQLRVREFCKRISTPEKMQLVILTFQANIREGSGKAQRSLSNITERVVSPGEQLSDLMSHCFEEITGAPLNGLIRTAVLSNSPPR